MKQIILFVLLSNIIFANNINSLEQRVEKINAGIEENTQKISNIEEKKEETAEKKIRLEKEIKEVEVEVEEINLKIKSVIKKIDYSETSLEFSSGEGQVTLEEYNAKLEAWYKTQRYSENDETFERTKRQFTNLLSSDIVRMEEIRSVTKDLDLVKMDIEKDKKELDALKYSLVVKEKQNKQNKIELEAVLKQLDKDKITATKTISSLKSEKKSIEAEIEKIIRERSKPVSDVKDVGTAKNKVGTLRKPIAGNYTTTFGKSLKGGVTSSGVEIRSSLGTITRAATSGKVIYSGKFTGLGKVVMVDYGYNLIGVYGNLISVDVEVGQNVVKAEKIGILGLSVDGTPDLYYELRFNLKPINPVSMF